MVDPNKPIIDPRTSVVGGQTPAAVTPGNRSSTPPAADTPTETGGASTSSSSSAGSSGSVPISTTIPAEYTASSYDELIPQLEKRMAEYRPLSEDELKKLRRRQKAEGIISGISDAVQSVANLIFTHRYAPNMYNGKGSMSAKAKERFEKEKVQREADADKFLHYALTIGRLNDADKQRGLQAWQMERTLARQRKDDERKEAMWPYERDTLIAKRDAAVNKADREYYDALIKKGEYENQPQKHEDAHNESLSKQGADKARATASYASAAASGRKDAVPTLTYYKDGKMVTERPRTMADYKRAVYSQAKRMGIETRIEVGKDAYGAPKYTRMSVDEVAGRVANWRPEGDGNQEKPFDKDDYKRGGNQLPPLN